MTKTKVVDGKLVVEQTVVKEVPFFDVLKGSYEADTRQFRAGGSFNNSRGFPLLKEENGEIYVHLPLLIQNGDSASLSG